MQNINKVDFKQIRQKTIAFRSASNNQNMNLNPSHKVSFRGIKRHNDHVLAQVDLNRKDQQIGSSTRLNSIQNKMYQVNVQQNCHKFSILLKSKGFSNSHNNSNQNKYDQISFRTLRNTNCHKYRINTERSQTSLGKLDVQKVQDEKYREVKKREFQNSKQVIGYQLSNIRKLKKKVISPQKIKNESQQQKITGEEKTSNNVQFSSILSQYDLVNTSKINQTIDFDMSPSL